VTQFRIQSRSGDETVTSDPFYVLSNNITTTPRTNSSLRGLEVSIDPNFDSFDIMRIQLLRQGANGAYVAISVLDRNNKYTYTDTSVFQPGKEERYRVTWQPKSGAAAVNWSSNTAVDFLIFRPSDEQVYAQYHTLALERLNARAEPILTFEEKIPALVPAFGDNYKTQAESRGALRNYFTQYGEAKTVAQMPPAYDAEAYFARLQKENDYIQLDKSVSDAYEAFNIELLKRIFSPAKESANLNDNRIVQTKTVMDTIVKDMGKDEFYQGLKNRQKNDFEETKETVNDRYKNYVFRVQNRYRVTLGLGGGYVWSPWEDNEAYQTNYFFLNLDLTFNFTPSPLIYAGFDIMYDVVGMEFREENPLYAGFEMGFFYYTRSRNVMFYLPLGVGLKLTEGVTDFMNFKPYFSVGIGLKFWEHLAFEVLAVHQEFDFKNLNAYQIRAVGKLQI
jgi:hypothetical protein